MTCPGVTRLVVGPLETNCYLVEVSPGRMAVIDPGAEGDEVARTVARMNASVSMVVITHAHIDHVAGLPSLLEAAGPCPVFLHGDDLPLWEAMALQGQFLGMDPPALPSGVHLLTHGQDLGTSEAPLSVIHSPGHSPGSICLSRGDGVLFSGDTLFRFGVGRTDLFGGSWERLCRSLSVLFTLPPTTVVFPGHGPATTIGECKEWFQAQGDLSSPWT